MNQVNLSLTLNKLKRNEKIWEYSYLIILGIVIARDYLCTTMFDVSWLTFLSIPIYLTTAVYAGAKILWYIPSDKTKRYTGNERIISIIVAIFFVLAALISGYHFLWELGFLIVGGKGVSSDRILRVYVIIGSIIILAALYASQNGMIENLMYDSLRGRWRNSFGIIYPTDFAAHIFFLIAAWICIGNKYVSVLNICAMIFASMFIYLNCVAYTSTICIVLLILLVIIIKICDVIGKDLYLIKKLNLLKGCFFIPCVLFLFLSIFYKENNPVFCFFDKVLSKRLSVTNEGIRKFGFSLLGQFVPEVGNGGSISIPEAYFFLDDSYVRIAIEYGVIILVICLILFYGILNKGLESKRYILVACLFVISWHCFMEQHMLEIAYNPFVLLYFSDMRNKNRKFGITSIELDNGTVV